MEIKEGDGKDGKEESETKMPPDLSDGGEEVAEALQRLLVPSHQQLLHALVHDADSQHLGEEVELEEVVEVEEERELVGRGGGGGGKYEG